jgi:hypothetical protein
MALAAAEKIDNLLTTVVNEAIVNQALRVAVQDCKFCVTIANPRGEDFPLIAVSEEFENMTGYKRTEILGVNCRFLNQGVEVDQTILLNLRLASKTGAPFTALLPNRKKTGELFLNLLDLRGLTVAVDSRTGEDLWFLVGIQADVSDLADEEIPESHIQELQALADFVRLRIVNELSQYVVASENTNSNFKLLESPQWRPGALLGNRKPTDAPATEFLARLQSVGSEAEERSRQTSSKVTAPDRGLRSPSHTVQEEMKQASSRGLFAVGIVGVVAIGLALFLLQQRRSAKR